MHHSIIFAELGEELNKKISFCIDSDEHSISESILFVDVNKSIAITLREYKDTTNLFLLGLEKEEDDVLNYFWGSGGCDIDFKNNQIRLYEDKTEINFTFCDFKKVIFEYNKKVKINYEV